jgi:amidase
MKDIVFDSALKIRNRIRTRETTVLEVVDAHLAAIEVRNPTVNSVVTICADQARDQAKELDAKLGVGEELGVLAGLPVGIKDTTDTKNIRTTYGSNLFEDHVPAADAAIVARIKQADGIVIGKTNTPEFAAGANTVNAVFGPTRNPWDTGLTVGGSTGGGAAGLASGFFALAEGTDLGGSLRIPAAFCGVTGIRTTPGLVPYLPNCSPFDLFDVEGPMARTIPDLALALNVYTGYDGYYAISPQTGLNFGEDLFIEHNRQKLSIAFASDIAKVGTDPDVLGPCKNAAEKLVDLGHTVDVIDLDLSAGREAFTTLRAQWMVNKHFDKLDQLSFLNDNLAGNIEKGLAQTPLDLAKAEADRENVWSNMASTLDRYDVVLTPVSSVNPFPVEQNYPETINGKPMASYIDWIASTFVISLIGLPAISVPAGLSSEGLPVGLQVIGGRYSEAKLLQLAHQIQVQNEIGLPLF